MSRLLLQVQSMEPLRQQADESPIAKKQGEKGLLILF